MILNSPYKLVDLKDVVFFQEGPGLLSSQFALQGEEGVPFINIRTICDDGSIDKTKCNLLRTSEFEKRYKHFLLDDGDYVVSSSGTLGKLAEIKGSDLPLMLNTSVIRFRSHNEAILDRGYLKWFVKSPLYEFQILKASTGTAIKNYGPSHLKKMLIPLPPLPIQKQIAALLEKADTLRSQCKQMEQELNQLAQSVFLEMFGDPKEVEELDSHIEFLTSGSRGWAQYYTDAGSRFIRSLDVQMNNLGEDDIAYVSAPNGKEAERTKVKYGDVLLTITGSRIGRVCWVSDVSMDGYISQHVAILRLKNTLLPEFLSYYLSMPSLGQRQIFKSQYGQTKPGLNLAQIRSFKIPRVSIQQQQQFVDAIYKLRELVDLSAKNKISIDENFNSLMQRAFSGKLNLTKAA
ncbi:MAG: restriction endonuclease subunit S [Candidatus Thiodiazotropha sp. (ex Ctena orbiculata)]|uniref:Restriction endonuclease subunit S n=1 Tax=Candidatus Thiodiazotropha taylori TaxID=2792791 RepID=A0A944QRX1_9GAMM|nr:restriction endonuclease subunit S [Candidatus Thiodiazotropha taylori]MBV2136378.1 restriction endonuclease subunit S [Candidatus Thiodiazotropha taylori]